MCPQFETPPSLRRTPTTIFLFEKGPIFKAYDRGELILEVDPSLSNPHKMAYHVLFVLYGLPAKIIYKGPGMGPKDVDHLEYSPTYRDLMFVRNLKRIIPNFSIDKVRSLIKSFYEDKLGRVEEYLGAWGFVKPELPPSDPQKLKVVVA